MTNAFKPLFDLREVWFVLFYVVLAVVFVFKDRYPLKKPFLAVFFCLLCITALAGTHFLPFMAWDKFPDTYPESETVYDLRVVTDDGRELTYDIRATLGAEGVYEPYLTTDMAEEYTYCENIRTMEHLLERAHAYRSQVERRSVLTFARFPPHGLVNMWTKKGIGEYGEFTGVRLYERKLQSSSDGTEIRSVSEELLIEYDGSATYECPSMDTIGASG